MLTIWKYEIPATDYFELFLPLNAKPLTAQVQYEKPQMWILLDKNETIYVNRKFLIVGTGHEISEPMDALQYIGTFQLLGDGLVFHVFEVPYVMGV